MKINSLLHKVIVENNILKTTKTKPIVDAIKNRNPVTFYYTGPQKPKKDSVKPGTRIEAEIVALGLSKRGNLIVRAWVQPPSVSKKGFDETGWRTFMVSRMYNVKIHQDLGYEIKRPDYKEGDDGSMTVTYVTADWGQQKQPEPEQQPTQQQVPQDGPPPPENEPQVEPANPEQLPQPKPERKPARNPGNVQHANDVYQGLQAKSAEDDAGKTITQIDYDAAIVDLTKRKENEWSQIMKNNGGNAKAGEGTRNRFKNDAKKELDKIMAQNNMRISDEPNNLQESIKRFKTLISY